MSLYELLSTVKELNRMREKQTGKGKASKEDYDAHDETLAALKSLNLPDVRIH